MGVRKCDVCGVSLPDDNPERMHFIGSADKHACLACVDQAGLSALKSFFLDGSTTGEIGSRVCEAVGRIRSAAAAAKVSPDKPEPARKANSVVVGDKTLATIDGEVLWMDEDTGSWHPLRINEGLLGRVLDMEKRFVAQGGDVCSRVSELGRRIDNHDGLEYKINGVATAHKKLEKEFNDVANHLGDVTRRVESLERTVKKNSDYIAILELAEELDEQETT